MGAEAEEHLSQQRGARSAGRFPGGAAGGAAGPTALSSASSYYGNGEHVQLARGKTQPRAPAILQPGLIWEMIFLQAHT